MNLPAGDRRLDAAAATQFEAVRLFIARAVAVRPDFQVTNENAPAVAGIAARLHGMPLAIELAAARVKLLSPEAILARLEHQLDVLSAGSRDLPERQQTLRGAIAWSHDLLGAGERAAARRLSVFVGGCELDAAEAVCGPAGELGGLDVLDGLTALADQSLVRSERGATASRASGCSTRSASSRRSSSTRAGDARRDRAAPCGDLRRPRRDARRRSCPATTSAAGSAGSSATTTTSAPSLDRAVAAGDADDRDPARLRDVAVLAEARPSRGGPAPARGDGRRAVVARRPASPGAPAWRRSAGSAGGRRDIPAMGVAYGEALALWQRVGDQREIANALYNDSFRVRRPRDWASARRSGPDGLRSR